jgi:hypothetical protein
MNAPLPHDSPVDPTRRRWLGHTLGAGAALLAAPLAVRSQTLNPPPGLRLWVPDAKLPIRLQLLDVQAEWLGRTVSTRIELQLFNPNARVLQGELQFPLAPGQSVSGFALDIDGELRPAVPVEKTRGREVFEAITREGADPALLQSTLGPHHSLRIYPLPARGVRRVVLQLTETLPAAPGATGQAWRLPLGGGLRAERVQLELRCVGRAASEAEARLGARWLPLADEPDGSAVLRWRGSAAEQVLQVSLQAPARPQPLVAVQRQGDEFFAYVEAPLATAWLAPRPRPRPRVVTLWWDACGSADARDRERELGFLQAWLQALQRTPGPAAVVHAWLLRDAAESLGPITLDGPVVADGLLEQLRSAPPDGASRLDALPLAAGSDLALLFSNGLATFGAPVVGLAEPAAVPVLALTSGADADVAGLTRFTQAGGGAVIDLAAMPLPQALAQAVNRPARLLGVTAEGLADIEFGAARVDGGVARVAARLVAPEGRLHLQLQRSDGGVERLTVAIDARAARAALARPLAPDLAVRQWAGMRLARLLVPVDEAETAATRRAEVRALGLHHGLVTPETSLIVLDTAADYARHGIDPPAALRAAVNQLLARGGQPAGEGALRDDLAGLRRDWQQRRTWWACEFPLPAPDEDAPGPGSAPPASLRLMGMAAPPPQAQAVAQAIERERMNRAASERRSAETRPSADALAAARAAARAGVADGTTIELLPFQPDSPALRRLRTAPAAQRYAAYLDERAAHAREAAFFLDVAELFFADGQAALGVRVASNLAALNLESRTLLRVLAFRLLAAGQASAAVPVLERVLRLAPDEAQSWRDLALALAGCGQPQRALDLLWAVAHRGWPRAAQGVREVALAELQALLVRHPGLEVRDIPADLRQPLPLDLRVVLSWDGDDTDVDLAVIDPDGLRCDFRVPVTRNGGRLTADNTSGFGPEEFGIRLAKPGRYRVLATLFGERRQLVAADTLLMLSLTTGFATPQARERQVVRRVSGLGDEVELGQFQVG